MTESMLRHGVSVLIPVYNSEGTIAAVCARVSRVLEAEDCEFEIILVEDRGTDGSWSAVLGLVRSDSRIRGIRFSRNYGQHAALLCAVRAARYSICVTLDDDLQHPPEEIPRLLEMLDSDYDVVYGTPRREQHGLLRDLASQITKLALGSAMGAKTARSVSAFRVMRTDLRDAFADFQGPFVTLDVLLTWGTTRFAAVKVDHEERETGRSNYTFRMLVSHALNMMTGFSAIPLQAASLVGFLMAIFGVGVLGYVLYGYSVHGHTVPGFTFLASLIAMFSGVQLFALGMIGEYLARMHFRVMNRPAYVIGDRTVEAGLGAETEE